MSASNGSRWLWVRHFPVAAKGVYVGQSDLPAVVPPPVSPEALWGADSELFADAVWLTSPLQRARQTLDWLRQSLGLPEGEIVVVPELMEQHFGAWEGQRYVDVAMNCARPETIQPPQGETFIQVTQRVHAWMDEALVRYAGQTVLCVCHAGAIRAALSHALAVPADAALRFQVDYASLSQTSYLHHEGAYFGRLERLNQPLSVN